MTLCRNDAGPGQNPGSATINCNGMFGVGGNRAIEGTNRPAVGIDDHGRSRRSSVAPKGGAGNRPCIDQGGFDGEHHAGPKREIGATLEPRGRMAGDRRGLVKIPTDAMACETLHQAISSPEGEVLHHSSDRAPTNPRPDQVDRGLQEIIDGVDQASTVFIDPTDGDGDRGIGTPTLEAGRHVDAHDLAFEQDAISGNAVHHHILDADADGGWKG